MASASQKTSPKFLAQGNSCVLKPALSCKNEQGIPTLEDVNDHISKVFNKDHTFWDEIQQNQAIMEIDKHSAFTIPAKDACMVHADNFPRDEIQKCTVLREDPEQPKLVENLHQIIYEYGGKDLHMLSQSGDMTFEEIFQAAHSIFNGLTKLNNARFVHQDIKPANIVYKEEKKQLYLIDFGLLRHYDQVFSQDNLEIVASNYPYFPPEYSMLLWVLENLQTVSGRDMFHKITRIHQQLPHAFEHVSQYMATDLQTFAAKVLKNWVAFCYMCICRKSVRGVHKVCEDEFMRISKKYTNFSKLHAFHPENLQDLSDLVAATFGNGETLLDERTVGMFANKLVKGGSKIDTYMFGMTLLEVFVTLEKRGALEKSDERFIHDCLELIHNMTRINVNARYDANDALKEYNRILMTHTIKVPALSPKTEFQSKPKMSKTDESGLIDDLLDDQFGSMFRGGRKAKKEKPKRK